MKKSRRPWSEGEDKRARGMRAAGLVYAEIDKALGRRNGSTKQRLQNAGYGSGHDVRPNPVPDDLWSERDALLAARKQHTLTENFFGDPPPGYSALHGKTGLR